VLVRDFLFGKIGPLAILNYWTLHVMASLTKRKTSSYYPYLYWRGYFKRLSTISSLLIEVYILHNSELYPSFCMLFKTWRFRDWILLYSFCELCLCCSSPETETSSVFWAVQSKSHLRTETESSLRNVVFWIKDRTINNVHNWTVSQAYMPIFRT
jgi:hypothetical protein